jgi:hypothetical protein
MALENARSEILQHIKTEMRNRMGQERLNMLSLMNIENEALHADFITELINQSATVKSSKQPLSEENV